ncbi:hypothetical protein [Methylobacterium indicum]|uniref:hypothetical protein n=1 Tax=Methylobacterium indicum TaxID=1775910 RepID=UPI000B1D463E|nr:hypothetical protein [Methylobacterium indicum]
MNKFIQKSNLDEDMSPKMEWISANDFDGVLLIESPGKDEFDEIVNSFCEKPMGFELAHCQFDGDLSYSQIDNRDDLFQGFFDHSYEEVFVNIIFQHENAVMWLPSEHKFYIVFARKTFLKKNRAINTKKLRQVATSFSREPYFTAMDKKYISESIEKYFTLGR